MREKEEEEEGEEDDVLMKDEVEFRWEEQEGKLKKEGGEGEMIK